MVVGAEAEDRGRAAERLGEVRHRRDPDAAGDEERPLDREVEAVPERAEDVDRVARPERAERPRARADRIDEERELARRRQAEAHRPRKHAAGSLEHEELARDARLERAALESEERVRADVLDGHRSSRAEPPATRAACDARRALAHASIPIRSCSESADSARAFAIACTAAAAPEIVVTHGTRATSAASRMR